MLSRQEKNKTVIAGNPLKCCQFQDSLNSIENDQNIAVCDSRNSFVKTAGNNNTSLQNKMENKVIFPKKLSVNVKFENITFTANYWNWNLKKLNKGKLFPVDFVD